MEAVEAREDVEPYSGIRFGRRFRGWITPVEGFVSMGTDVCALRSACGTEQRLLMPGFSRGFVFGHCRPIESYVSAQL